MVIFSTFRLYPLLVFWQKNVCTCNCNGKTGRQPKSGCIFYTDRTFGAFSNVLYFVFSIYRCDMGIYVNKIQLYRLRLSLPTHYDMQINCRQYFIFFELFLKYPDVAQFRWLCTHEHLHENDDGGIQHVLLKIYAFWTTSSDNFYFIFIFVFLDRLYNNTGWSFSTNFHIYYRNNYIDLIYYIWCM